MTRKKREQRIEISDERFFAGLEEVKRFDAESLKALALFLNEHKKSKERMKAASAEIGRNARHLARAVDYFGFAFGDMSTTDDSYTADDYLKLFCYAQLKKELAMDTYVKYGFSYPLWRTRELVDAAKPVRAKRETLAERCANLAVSWGLRAEMTPSAITAYTCSSELLDIPVVAAEMKRREGAGK